MAGRVLTGYSASMRAMKTESCTAPILSLWRMRSARANNTIREPLYRTAPATCSIRCRPASRCFSTSPSRLSEVEPFTNVFRDVSAFREYRRKLLLDGRTVGLVPTMGALHDGHLSLIRQAAAENTDIVVTIYVNPTQFGVNEDLASYPRTWDSDVAQLKKLDEELASEKGAGRVGAIFAPTSKTMYPTLPPSSEIPGQGSFVTITPLGTLLEGESRPVFFRGVATVCMKLFNIVQPERAYFGQKDVQQTVVVKRMVKDFHLPLEIKIGPTRREEDGLAMSSRNVYLGKRRRAVAIVLSQALRRAEEQYEKGKRSRGDILWAANDATTAKMIEQDELPPAERARFEVDYISLADPESMEELDEVDDKRGAILSAAIKMLPIEEPRDGEELGLGGSVGTVRLIDNIILKSTR